jgi:SAM-dependent methyltransferase
MSWECAVQWLKTQPEHVELVRACFFDDPLAEAANRYHQCREWAAVRLVIGPAKGQALDIGSGRGISSFALAKDGWQTTAFEPNESSEVGAGAIRRLSAETGVSIKVVEGWGEQLPFLSNSFDLVHCRQVLHHARDLRLFCREAARVLKPNGLFVATREHVLSRAEDLDCFLDRHPLHHMYGGENASILTEYTSAITAAGIKLVKVLNPLQSDINMFPQSRLATKQGLARKIHLSSPSLIPDWLLSLAGGFLNQPGRLYSFVGKKPASKH